MRRGVNAAGGLPVVNVAARMKPQRESTDDSAFGVFQNMRINPFPVRAAIDIGTCGMASLAVGRVDAAANAVRDLMYQTQLPLRLESAGGGARDSSSFVLSEATRADIRNKMRVLHGALRRDSYEGLSERAAVITWPLCEADDALALADELTREFRVDVRVLGKTFNVSMPFGSSMGSSVGVEDELRAVGVCKEEPRAEASAASDSRNGEGDLILSFLQRADRQRQMTQKGAGLRSKVHFSSGDGNVARVPPSQQMEQLAFLAHAAVSKCIAPQRLLVLAEDFRRGICILGAEAAKDEGLNSDGSADRTRESRNSGCGKEVTACQETDSITGILVHTLPTNLEMAHRLLVTTVQRRSEACAEAVCRRSPNPVLRGEFRKLRSLLEETVYHTLPQWVVEKSNAGGLICGSSFNGGVLNIAARVAQRSSVSLDHLETHAEMHYCGLTDVLMSVNYPDPTSVLPAAALASALLRSLDTQRFEYLPEVHIPAALLLQPSLWTYTRRNQVREALKKKSFYAGGSMRRTFQRPHTRENPTAPPTASWQKNREWNSLSYDSSTKGT